MNNAYIYLQQIQEIHFWYQVGDTHEDFPLPVGPRIALRPGLIIPLQDNNTELSVTNSTWINSFKRQK